MTPEQIAHYNATVAVHNNMYTAAVALHKNEVMLRWTRTQIFFLIHSASLSFVTTQLKQGEVVHMGACVIGIALAVLWLRLTVVIRKWITYWDSQLSALEGKIEGRRAIRIFKNRRFKKAMKERFGAHRILLGLGLIFLLVWLILFAASTLKYLGIQILT